MQRKFKARVLVLAVFAGGAAGTMSDADSGTGHRGSGGAQAPHNALYSEECGGCHLAYPPGMLPALSWEAIMAGLDDHFADNAALPPDQVDLIRGYLLAHAGGSPASRQPLRITEARWFRNEHDEVPLMRVKDNPGVRSFSNCEACHGGAARGSFDEHAVRIPGYGRWED